MDEILFPNAEYMDGQQHNIPQHDWVYNPAYTGT